MDANSFTYWLQGFFELTDADNLSTNQVKIIKEHLKLVFNKKTPEISLEKDFSKVLRGLYEECVKKENIEETYIKWLELLIDKEKYKTIKELTIIHQPELGICTNDDIKNTVIQNKSFLNQSFVQPEKFCSVNCDVKNMSNKDNQADFEKVVNIVEDAIKVAESGKIKPKSMYHNDDIKNTEIFKNIKTHATC